MSPLRIGLTGGIGSGKSTVSALLAARGAAVLDTDLVARRLTLPGGAAIDLIRATFGAAFIGSDGALDRPRMREAAFADPARKRSLEAILHPLIGTEVERMAAEGAATSPLLVFDVPLLVESGRWRARVDRVWLVDCSEAVQVERVVVRSGWTEDAARSVVAQQATRQARRAAADAVIHNDGITLDELEQQVQLLWEATIGAGP